MKRVSFEVAKALKKAGYPQEQYINRVGEYIGYSNYYTINNEHYKLCRTREHIEYYASTYLDAWLWLWRKKKSIIQVLFDGEWYCQSTTANQAFSSSDPEEAIIAAIDYLVDNDLIK